MPMTLELTMLPTRPRLRLKLLLLLRQKLQLLLKPRQLLLLKLLLRRSKPLCSKCLQL